MKSVIKSMLRKFGYEAIKQDYLFNIVQPNKRDLINLYIMNQFIEKLRSEDYAYLGKTRSQIGQDLFVASYFNFKRRGFFVDFGATDGIEKNNSYILETELGWSGILSEPARVWHDALRNNRIASIDNRCVWKKSNDTLEFLETNDPEISTITDFAESDKHSANRRSAEKYSVETVSLVDLLDEYKAPTRIDYLSIDTEGSEYDILQAFDFDKYKFEVITCEHNHTEKRQDIYNLLTQNNYKRVLEDVSEFDDWYILKS